MLQLGDGSLIPQVTGHRLLENGVEISSCRYDETDYVNPDSSMQWTGRIVLNHRDAVVVMPRDPLVGGKTYTVEIATVSGTTTWSFTVDSSAAQNQEAILPQGEMGSVPPAQ